MTPYVIKVGLLATCAGTIAWAAVMLCWFAVDMYWAKNHDAVFDDIDPNDLANIIDEMEEMASTLRYHCNQLEIAIMASPAIGLIMIPMYKIQKYMMEAVERQAGCARRELMRKAIRQAAAAQEASNGQAH